MQLGEKLLTEWSIMQQCRKNHLTSSVWIQMNFYPNPDRLAIHRGSNISVAPYDRKSKTSILILIFFENKMRNKTFNRLAGAII
jgi:hypothetical protein